MTVQQDRRPVSALFPVICTGILCSFAFAAETGLNRAEVAAIKAKLVAVEKAMGGDPAGYTLDAEDFSLPTDFNPARAGKFWPISSSVSLRYTDKAVADAEDNAEQVAADFQARYIAAIASGNEAAANAAMAEMMNAQSAGSEPKEDMTVYVQFNMNPYAGIDPDGVLFEGPGVIALRNKEVSSDTGQVVVYVDPVALRETETLSKIELKTPEDGVSNRAGVFNVTITMNGNIDDIESRAKGIDVAGVLAVVDSQ